jgi:hypothetical protein
MFEVSFNEAALFIWAAFATAKWLKVRDEMKHAKIFLTNFLNDEKMREDILRQHRAFMQSTND